MIYLLPLYIKNTGLITNTDCIIWTGRITSNGYGQIDHSGITEMAHRFAYKLFTGNSISKRKQIDHICRNRKCVNPDHLRQVSVSDNHLNSKTSDEGGLNKVKCKRGHDLTNSANYNIYTSFNGRKYKNCRICKKLLKDIY